MKLKGLSPIIDYAYLNVLDIVDPDYSTTIFIPGTHCKLEAYMIEDKLDYQVFSQLQKPEILKKAVVVIMLDFTTPWTFMEKLDHWINFLKEIQRRAGLSILDLE
jgi:dynein light intermediate chain 1